ncbi:MAG: M18 family aminopeptidase [Lachnospiraceae bacterium]|nr:M18 family aminopeptidase [Lachnospiraceae bacterium]
MATAKDLLTFIKESPSAFHVISNMEKELSIAGFHYLPEGHKWDIQYGESYYTKRNDTSLIAWRMPEKEARGFHIAAAHSDSPAFLVKENPEVAGGQYIRLNTEKYGGMILSTWLDRPLSVAGRVSIAGENGVESRLVHIDRDLLVIPSLAIHMERKLNAGYEYNAQKDMLPIFTEKEGKSFRELVAEYAGVEPDEILGQELYLYVRDEGHIIGRDEEWLMSPRLDDLQCVYGILQGLKSKKPSEYISMAAIFHNEEVGSTTRQGADSTFLSDVLAWIGEALGMGDGERRRMIVGSFLISADNAHGVHPAHKEKADPTNQPVLNGGVVIKFHGNQKYTSDAMTAGTLRLLCKEAGISSQTYHNRSDIAGGSTLGNISVSHVSVPSVDIGLAQLAMHSAMETAGSRDLDDFIRLLTVYYGK